ncbi:S8 family serine peptidase [Streptomyces sp. NPDC058374]|uniref:S8 family serine peptidase n=1 Tax=Streptomyces sp. NPDC058374 TaxID=3346466 RepID=UPI00365E0169
MRRPGPGLSRPLCGAALAAVLLLSGTAPAGAGPPEGVPAADGKGQELPGMPSVLADRTGCTPASKAKAEKQDWSRQRLDLERVRRHGTGAGVTVALIDTGVATGAAGTDGRVTARGAAGEDCVGHGTFLAGLIAGSGRGDARLAGVAPGAELLALRGTDERGRPEASLVTRAVRDATEAGAEVIAVGVALPERNAGLTRAVADAVEAGAVVVAAAAPDPPSRAVGKEIPARTYWPAGEPGVLSVADMLPGGARPDGALPTDSVDLVAPGAGVVSGGPRGSGHYLGSGPSVAAAYAAGTAAVVRGTRPDDSPEEVARRLRATAYPADIPQLDAYAAVTAVLGEPGGAAVADTGSEPVALRDTAAADRATGRAVVFVLIGTAGVLAVLWAGYAVPRARARGWRSADAGGK